MDNPPLSQRLEALRQQFDDIVDPLVPSGPVALLDFPNHANVGDSAIWMGEIAWLARRPDCPVRYVADNETFDPGRLRRAMPRGTVLLHGGGNFGDVWPRLQECRYQYLDSLRDFRIVQLPQSIHFADAAAAQIARQRVADHPDFIVLVRSRASLEIAITLGFPQVALVPDAAFLLTNLRAPDPTEDYVVLARTDHEQKQPLRVDGVDSVDWLQDDWPMSYWRMHGLGQRVFRNDGVLGRTLALRWANRLAAARVRRGVRQIARGRTVVSDRLHASLLALLIGRSVIALDNSYGKVRSVMDTWLPGCRQVTWVDQVADLPAILDRSGLPPA